MAILRVFGMHDTVIHYYSLRLDFCMFVGLACGETLKAFQYQRTIGKPTSDSHTLSFFNLSWDSPVHSQFWAWRVGLRKLQN